MIYVLPSTGSGRQQPILLAESVLLHQPAEDPEQADQVEALPHHGEATAPDGSKGLVMVPRRRNATGFTDPLRPCGPSLRPPQGPDVHLPKMSTLRRWRRSGKDCDW